MGKFGIVCEKGMSLFVYKDHSDEHEPEKAYTTYKSHLAGDGLNDSFDHYNHKTEKVFLKCNPTGGAGNGHFE